MIKSLAISGIAVAFSVLPIAAHAQQGTSSSWGSVGWGPVIPTQELTPRDRSWNQRNLPRYQAEMSAEWLRQHGKGMFPFF
jgi:hypothetical protein